jgi:two-component system CheB/CheR fusion protein
MPSRKVVKIANHKEPATPAKLKSEKTVAGSFPIVGMGASAGGLEAFEQFFRSVLPDSGMAFVLVPHLDPGHESILTEILQRSTAMPVVEAQDQLAVEPNRVYVIPPNRDMAIFHGILQLSMPEAPRGHRMPIDAFLRSLAEDQGEQAVGVILSGTGTDGTLGLRAILGAGGVSLVQEPTTAKYDGMPASAIQAGHATYVVSVENMPEALRTGIRIRADRQEVPSTSDSSSGLNHVLMVLRSGTDHDFSQYKKTTIGRRIERRMSQHSIEDMDVYARYLKEHPDELQSLFKELLINVTSFFRDPQAFATLKKNILPRLVADKPEGYVFRVWVAGCASGEEAYSIAILLRELMDETKQEFKVQIYSTDLDEDAIVVARAGSYSPNIIQDVLPERLRFFVKEETGYRVKKDLREMVVFATQNVIKDPPFTKLDLVSCRNLLIYLEPELQDRLVAAFHYALKPGGVLFLSPSENTGRQSDLFAALSRPWKLYQAISSASSTRAVLASGLSWTTLSGRKRGDDKVKLTKETNFAELTKRMLLQSYAPASVVTDLKGNIRYVHGETGKYLCPAPGQATLNVVEMARGDMQLELRAAVHSAASPGAKTLSHELSVKINGDLQTVILTVRPLPDPDGGEALLLVSFQEVALAKSGKSARDKRSTRSIHTRRSGLHEGEPPGDHRGTAGFKRRIEVHERGDAIHQRGIAIDQ